MSGIMVKNITKKFGDFVAVNNVSFDVKEGELAALLGPSGSGKSTLLRVIAGLENADMGQIFLTGKNVTPLRTQKRNVGFVFQHYALFKHMTVEKNIAFGLEIQKKDKKDIKQKVEELIDLVKLNGYNKHYPSQLSGGQRQRVALARALATEPKVLLLDEPFGSLDAKVRKNLAQWIRDLHSRVNVTSVFVTHDQNEAIEISDKIIVINRGKVEQIGNATDVYEHPKSKFVASFVGNVNVINANIKKNHIVITGTKEKIQFKEKTGISFQNIVLLIRPEDIIVKDDSTDDTVPCIINGIYYRGSFYEVDLKVGTNNVKSLVPKEDFFKFEWQKGTKVYIRFRKFKIFEASEGHKKVHEMLKQLGYIE